MPESDVNRAIDRMHAPVGRLAIVFEHLVDAIRQVAIECFEFHGLMKSSLAQVALSGLTAGPLLAAFESLVRESWPMTSAEEDLLSEIVRRHRLIIQKRNLVIHGRWTFIDFAAFPELLPDGLVQTDRRTSKGLKTEFEILTAEDIELLVGEVADLRALVVTFRNLLANHGLQRTPARAQTGAAET